MALFRCGDGSVGTKPDYVYQLTNVGSATGYNMFDFTGATPTNSASEAGFTFNLPNNAGSVAPVGTTAIKLTANVGMTVIWGTGREYQHASSTVHLSANEELSMNGAYASPCATFCVILD